MPIIFILLFTLHLYADGLEFFKKGTIYTNNGKGQDFKKAKKEFERSCYMLYDKGCFELAKLHQKGIGTPIDIDKAIENYTKSCQLGNGDACAYLGLVYEELTPPKHLLAQDRYTEACDIGSGAGCAKLGLMHLNHKALNSNPKKAKEYLELACRLKSGLGCIELSQYNIKTRGSLDDYLKAIGLYKKRCSSFYSDTCLYLGFIYMEGNRVAVDRPQALQYFNKACRFKNLKGCEVVRLYKDNNNSKDFKEYKISPSKPIIYNLKSAREHEELGYRYARGINLPKDETKAYQLYQESCRLGNAKGCYRVGVANLEAKGTKQNNQLANTFLRKACYRDYSYGCSTLGFLYQYGEGVEIDLKIANRYYNRSCKLGDNGGCILQKSLNI